MTAARTDVAPDEDATMKIGIGIGEIGGQPATVESLVEQAVQAEADGFFYMKGRDEKADKDTQVFQIIDHVKN